MKQRISFVGAAKCRSEDVNVPVWDREKGSKARYIPIGTVSRVSII